MSRILVLDNHDSFVYTLVDYLRELGATVDMTEADEVPDHSVGAALAGYDGVLISPGPGTPAAAGSSVAAVRVAARMRLPLLGVCLGHQAIGEAFGATVDHAPELMHGLTSEVTHDGSMLFDGIDSPFSATRYHSLTIVPSSLPDQLRATAHTESGVIMAVEHRDAPMWGVQFHPESVLTDGGYRLLGNWLATTGMIGAPTRGAELAPRR